MIASMISTDRLQHIIDEARLPREIVINGLEIITEQIDDEVSAVNYCYMTTAEELGRLIRESWQDACGGEGW